MSVGRRKQYRSFLERTARDLREAVERVATAERAASASGVLQQLDPRVKVLGLVSLVTAATMARSAAGILGVFAIALVLAVSSRLSMTTLASRVWAGGLLFGGAIALPACVLTPGDILFRVPGLHWPVTSQGVTTAAYLLLRVETATTLAALLVFTTPWTHVLKALRALHVPVLFVVVLAMTYRYILLLLQSAQEMFESRRSRVVGEMRRADSRRLAVATAGVLLGKTMQLGNDVYLAMQARGFRGDLRVLDEFRMRRHDWIAAAACAALIAGAIWVGR